MLREYSLSNLTANRLHAHLKGNVDARTDTVFEAILHSIQHSAYVGKNSSPNLAAVLYSAYPLIISEWTSLVLRLDSDFKAAETSIEGISEPTTTLQERRERFALSGHALRQTLHTPAFYEWHVRALTAMQDTIDEWAILRSELPGNQSINTTLVKSDLAFLIRHVQRLQHGNAALLSRRDDLAFSLNQEEDDNKVPEEHPRKTNAPQEKSSVGESPAPSTSRVQHHRGAGGSPPRGNGPPPDVTDSNGDYSRHLETRIDQIAYMTNILFSLSLIASVYGMNLSTFVDGGQVQLSQYLTTALPFAFVVFIVTFALPGMVKWVMSRRLGNGGQPTPRTGAHSEVNFA